MPSSYPAALDALNNPSGSDTQSSTAVLHSSQHTNANDAIEAVQAELGTDPSGTFATVKARLDDVATLHTAHTGATGDAVHAAAKFAIMPDGGRHIFARATAPSGAGEINGDIWFKTSA